jgi:hypothetical protein
MDQNLTCRIRERAYEIWATNGYRNGEADQHWLTAEREILQASVIARVPARSPATKAAAAPIRPRLRKAGRRGG